MNAIQSQGIKDLKQILNLEVISKSNNFDNKPKL